MRETLEEREDQDLVAAVLEGDREVYGELVGRYQARLVRFLSRVLGDADEARDVAQDVFLKVYQALDRYDPSFRFSTWLFRVAQNAAIDRLRRRRLRWVPLQSEGPDGEGERNWDLPAEGPDAQEQIETKETGSIVRRAVRTLPWEYRELILLRHYGELAYAEIAELKGMPLGTVKNKLFRARRLLEEKLDADPDF